MSCPRFFPVRGEVKHFRTFCHLNFLSTTFVFCSSLAVSLSSQSSRSLKLDLTALNWTIKLNVLTGQKAHVWFLKEVAERNLGKNLQISCDHFSSLTKNTSATEVHLDSLSTSDKRKFQIKKGVLLIDSHNVY